MNRGGGNLPRPGRDTSLSTSTSWFLEEAPRLGAAPVTALKDIAERQSEALKQKQNVSMKREDKYYLHDRSRNQSTQTALFQSGPGPEPLSASDASDRCGLKSSNSAGRPSNLGPLAAEGNLCNVMRR